MPGKLLPRGLLFPRMSHSIVPSVKVTRSSQITFGANKAALPLTSGSQRAGSRARLLRSGTIGSAAESDLAPRLAATAQRIARTLVFIGVPFRSIRLVG